MLATAKMQAYDHSLRIPMLFAGPGIKHSSTIEWLGTQVDIAPTILGLAGIPTPADMDGRSIVPLLVSSSVAATQGETLPGSVSQTLARHVGEAPMTRAASFHTYYNQGDPKTKPFFGWFSPISLVGIMVGMPNQGLPGRAVGGRRWHGRSAQRKPAAG